MHTWFGGDFVSLVVVLLILADTFSPRLIEKTRKDSLFRSIVYVSLIIIGLGIFRSICLDFSITTPVWLNITILSFHGTGILLILFLWSLFTFEQLYEDSAVVKRLTQILIIAGMLCTFILLIWILFLYSNIQRSRILINAITVIWVASLIFLIRVKGTSLPLSAKRTLLIAPLLLISAIFLYTFSFNHTWVSTAVSIITVMTYMHIQHKRISIDQLSGLITRNACINRLATLCASSSSGVVIIVDIVKFSYFNQRFGQKNGDRLLIAIGRFFNSLPLNWPVCRYGGDQFALIVTEEQKTTQQKILSQIRERFSSPWSVGEARTTIQVHLAVIPFTSEIDTTEELISAIDLTIDRAKYSNAQEITFFSKEIRNHQLRQQEVEAAIRRALEANTLCVMYQPIYETESLHIYSAEALSRIEDPLLGTISPLEFIPIAEKTGLIIELTYNVLRKVCELWEQIGSSSVHLQRIAINLSAVHFLEPDMEAHILETLQSHGVSPRNINFELTESMLVHSFDRVKTVMEAFAEQDITFSLDDYGTGYANLDSVIRLPFSTVKIDKTIVQACQKNYTLIDSIVLMLRRMDRKVVAEGVETEEQLKMLARAGVSRIQGFYFSRPMSAEDFLACIS